MALSSSSLPLRQARLFASASPNAGSAPMNARVASSGSKKTPPSWESSSPAIELLPAPFVPARTVMVGGEMVSLFAVTGSPGYGSLTQLLRGRFEGSINSRSGLWGLHSIKHLVELATESLERCRFPLP